MNISIIAAEIARRIPEMAKDSVTNNEGVILRILEEEHNRSLCFAVDAFGKSREWIYIPPTKHNPAL